MSENDLGGPLPSTYTGPVFNGLVSGPPEEVSHATR